MTQKLYEAEHFSSLPGGEIGMILRRMFFVQQKMKRGFTTEEMHRFGHDRTSLRYHQRRGVFRKEKKMDAGSGTQLCTWLLNIRPLTRWERVRWFLNRLFANKDAILMDGWTLEG